MMINLIEILLIFTSYRRDPYEEYSTGEDRPFFASIPELFIQPFKIM